MNKIVLGIFCLFSSHAFCQEGVSTLKHNVSLNNFHKNDVSVLRKISDLSFKKSSWRTNINLRSLLSTKLNMTDSAALAQENIIVVKGKIGYLLKFHYYNIKGILPFIEGTTSYSKNKKNSEDPKESSCKKRTELGLGAGVQILLEKKLTAQIMGNYMKSTYKEKSVRVGLTYKF